MGVKLAVSATWHSDPRSRAWNVASSRGRVLSPLRNLSDWVCHVRDTYHCGLRPVTEHSDGLW